MSGELAITMSDIVSGPSLPDLMAALKELSVEQTWELILLLGMRSHTVNDIVYCSRNNDETKTKFLRVWFLEEINPSWVKIVSALKQIGMHALAARIEREFVLEKAKQTRPACSVPVDSPPMEPVVIPVVEAALPSSNGTPLETASQAGVRDHVKIDIAYFVNEFSNIVTSLESALSHKHERDKHFLDKFRYYILSMPVAKNPTHARFFRDSEDDILEARSVRKMIAILLRYCSYSNYEIIYHIIKRFGNEPLETRMEGFRKAHEAFEKRTSIDAYLLATSAHPDSEICAEFNKMAVKINKPTSECTLYEVRMLKEMIVEKASLYSYSAYIQDIAES